MQMRGKKVEPKLQPQDGPGELVPPHEWTPIAKVPGLRAPSPTLPPVHRGELIREGGPLSKAVKPP